MYEQQKRSEVQVEAMVELPVHRKTDSLFVFLALLAVVYIYNGHHADRTIREISKTGRELKELQYEYKSVKGDVLFRSKQSELTEAVKPLGLKELMAEPVVLIDSSEN